MIYDRTGIADQWEIVDYLVNNPQTIGYHLQKIAEIESLLTPHSKINSIHIIEIHIIEIHIKKRILIVLE